MEVKCSSFPPNPHSAVLMDGASSVTTTVQCDFVVFVMLNVNESSELSAVQCR